MSCNPSLLLFIKLQLARIEAQLASPSSHAPGPRKPTLSQQEDQHGK